jgi:hypothetical protein
MERQKTELGKKTTTKPIGQSRAGGGTSADRNPPFVVFPEKPLS